MKPITLYFISRADGTIQHFETCYSYTVTSDYINQDKSLFTISDKYTPRVADFLIVKNGVQKNLTASTFKPFYSGIIDSYDDSSESAGLMNVSTLPIIHVFDFEFLSFGNQTDILNPSFEHHLVNLLSKFFFGYPNDNMTSFINLSAWDTATNFTYIPNDPPSVTNFIQYVINGFKKYNIVFDLNYVEVKSNNMMMFYFYSDRKEKAIKIKNNISTFINWNVYIKESSIFDYNKIQIIDGVYNQYTNTTIAPNILYEAYVDRDGNILTYLSDNVIKPTKCKVVPFDTLQEDPPSYLSIAQTELQAIPYSHEITFQVPYENQFLNVNDIYIGLLVDIYYKQQLYKSVLTGYSIDSNTKLITLTFGNIRATLKYVYNYLKFY